MVDSGHREVGGKPRSGSIRSQTKFKLTHYPAAAARRAAHV
jgi:hypothetical protein